MTDTTAPRTQPAQKPKPKPKAKRNRPGKRDRVAALEKLLAGG